MAAKASTDQPAAFALDSAATAIASARRAALADRYAASSFTVEWRALDELATIADAWRALAARALESNVFYEPAFALAAAPVFGRDAGAVLIWSGASPRQLLGLFPLRTETRRYGLKLPVLTGWTHPYAPLGVPLVDRDTPEPVVAAFLAHVAAEPALPGLLLWPFLPTEGAFAMVLERITQRAQMPGAGLNRHRRAALAPGRERSRYTEQALGRRKLKELRRLVRRLGDSGAVMFASAKEPAAVATALADFFALEASGWKGRAATAAAVSEHLCAFVQTAVATLAAEKKVAINRVLLDGTAIAAAIVLHSAGRAWFWKIAYDEAFARFSPGVLATVALTEEIAEDVTIECADSCATEDHPMIGHIWRERLSLCDRLIAVRPQAPFGRARSLETLRCAAIAWARGIRDRFRR